MAMNFHPDWKPFAEVEINVKTSDEIVPVDLIQKLRTGNLYGAAFLARDAADEIERLRASVELLRFAANEALTAIESDPDIEQGWPNTVSLLRAALGRN